MSRLLRLLAIYTWRGFLEAMAWRGFLVTLTLNQAITPLLGMAVWSAALPGTPGLTAYFIALFAVQLATVSYEHHTLSNGIYGGAFGMDLLGPHPAVIGTFGGNLALRIWHLAIGLPIVLVAALATGVAPDPRLALLALPALVLAAALRFLFTYTLALSALWTQQAHGLVGFGETLIFLLGGAAAPVPLLPRALHPLGVALPFRAMLGFPAEITTGGLSAAEIAVGYGWQLGWLAVLAATAALVWRSGVRRYTAVGG